MTGMAQQQGGPVRAEVIRANGAGLWVEVWGAGPPLVLVEGMAVGTWIWERQLPDLADHFTTVAYDLRGSGKSEKPEGPYTIALMAEDLAGVLDALDIRSAHVAGVSQGGFIALEFALRWPERVRRLVLMATSAGGAGHVPMSQETFARFMDNSGEPRERTRRKLALAYTEEFLRGPDVEHLIDLRLRDPQPPQAFQAQAMAGVGFDRSADVQRITAPTLVLAGEGDVLVPVENARRLAAAIPRARLRTWPRLGHQFFVEAAEDVTREIITFLQSEEE
jgi:pimeloyl-ACP methyl ester carboxylesterase